MDDKGEGCNRATAETVTDFPPHPSAPTEPAALRRPQPVTPTRPPRGFRCTPSQIPPFRPYPGNPTDPLTGLADEFLNSQRFELICAQANQLAGLVPVTPPPFPFISSVVTPMHQWYEALVVEFTNAFTRILRSRNAYPVTMELTKEGLVRAEEDLEEFNAQACTHINAILRSFHINATTRPFGSLDMLSVDVYQKTAQSAAMALLEVTQPAYYPPKAAWKMGEALHTAYRRRLWMFRMGVIRQLQGSSQDNWILSYPHLLERGIGAYSEFFMAHLREDILKSRGPFLR